MWTSEILPPSSVLDDKWRIERVLGEGSTSVVYAAVHIRTAVRGALKVLEESRAKDLNQRDLFLGRGYAANLVNHAGGVSVLDEGILSNGRAYLVMERLVGEDLATLAKRRPEGALSFPEVVAAADAALQVLTAAHDVGVMHHALKPERLFVTHAGVLKIIGFGLSGGKESAAYAMMCSAGLVAGAPAFMPWEQARGDWHLLDARTDVYSLAASLWKLATGRLVHEASSVGEALAKAIRESAKPLRRVLPTTPPAIASVFDKALEREREARWKNAGAMLEALREAVRVHGFSMVALPRGAPSVPDPSPRVARLTPRAAVALRRRAGERAPDDTPVDMELPVMTEPSAVVSRGTTTPRRTTPVIAAPNASRSIEDEADDEPTTERVPVVVHAMAVAVAPPAEPSAPAPPVIVGARAFFDEVLPGLLANGLPRLDSARYRVYVLAEGAWEIDMKGARPRVRAIDKAVALDRAVGAVVVDADVFARLRASRGSPSEIRAAVTNLPTLGDRDRALDVLRALVSSPPLVWPASVRVHRLPTAFFRAKPAELTNGFPGWHRPPLGHPKSSFAPGEPPFAFVPFQSRYRWQQLLELYTWLVPNDEDVVADLLEDQRANGWTAADVVAAQLFPEALRGSPEIAVRTVPPLFTGAIAALKVEELRANNARAGAVGGHAFHHSHLRWLRPLRELARAAIRGGEQLWFWDAS